MKKLALVPLLAVFLVSGCGVVDFARREAADKADEKQQEAESVLAKGLQEYGKSIDDFDENNNGRLDKGEDIEAFKFITKKEGVEFGRDQLGGIKNEVVGKIASGQSPKEAILSTLKEKVANKAGLNWKEFTKSGLFAALLIIILNRLVAWLRPEKEKEEDEDSDDGGDGDGGDDGDNGSSSGSGTKGNE